MARKWCNARILVEKFMEVALMVMGIRNLKWLNILKGKHFKDLIELVAQIQQYERI